MNWLLVAAGGAVGSLLRYGAGLALNQPLWPWGTWLVNAVGSFLIGAAYVWSRERAWLSPELYLLFATGVLGGFTTFSAFSLESVTLWMNGHALRAALYVLASIAAGLIGASLGIWAGRQLI